MPLSWRPHAPAVPLLPPNHPVGRAPLVGRAGVLVELKEFDPGTMTRTDLD